MTTLTRKDVFFAIEQERDHQGKKWGTLDEHPHEVGSWLTIMRQLLNDAERAYMSQRGDIGALDELRKVVAVGVACMEQHGVPPRVRKEPHINLEAWREAGPGLSKNGDGSPRNMNADAKNPHPTVKPTELMRYLCRLVTPPGGLIVDPFAGSGSTGKAAILEGFQFVGFELDPQYTAIANARVEAARASMRVDNAAC